MNKTLCLIELLSSPQTLTVIIKAYRTVLEELFQLALNARHEVLFMVKIVKRKQQSVSVFVHDYLRLRILDDVN